MVASRKLGGNSGTDNAWLSAMIFIVAALPGFLENPTTDSFTASYSYPKDGQLYIPTFGTISLRYP